MKIQDSNRGAAALAGLGQSKEAQMLRAAKSGAESGDAATEADVAKSFEEYFATMLVKEMRSALPKGFFSGAGADVYSGWFDEHLGASLARRDSLGFAGMIKTAIARESSPSVVGVEGAEGAQTELRRDGDVMPLQGDAEPIDLLRATDRPELTQAPLQAEFKRAGDRR